MDTVNLRMVARTFRAVRGGPAAAAAGGCPRWVWAGIATNAESSPVVGAVVHPATVAGAEYDAGAGAPMNRLTSREGQDLVAYAFGGRMRTSTLVPDHRLPGRRLALRDLRAADGATQVPASEVVPPGLRPGPHYTWAPRTDVQPQPHDDGVDHDDVHHPTTPTSPAATTASPAPEVCRRPRPPPPRHGDARPASPTTGSTAPSAPERPAAATPTPAVPASGPRRFRNRQRNSGGQCIVRLLRRARRSSSPDARLLACRDDHPRPCHRAVQGVSPSCAGQRQPQGRQG